MAGGLRASPISSEIMKNMRIIEPSRIIDQRNAKPKQAGIANFLFPATTLLQPLIFPVEDRFDDGAV